MNPHLHRLCLLCLSSGVHVESASFTAELALGSWYLMGLFSLICKANCSAEPASTLRSAKHAVSLCYQEDCLLALCLAQSSWRDLAMTKHFRNGILITISCCSSISEVLLSLEADELISLSGFSCSFGFSFNGGAFERRNLEMFLLKEC